MSKKQIGEVFTPRNPEINEAMYVQRPELEKELRRSLQKNTHVLIFGDSGNGKSWLYKNVLSQLNLPYITANCANAARKSSLTKEICDSIDDSCSNSADNHLEFEISEPLLEAFRVYDRRYSGKKIIVLDNLESIFARPTLMEELANIVILLDDARYARNSVNFLIVGVPNDVLNYYAKTENLDSVANRIEEITKVSGLKVEQVAEIINKGFSQLEVTLDAAQRLLICNHTFNVTLGIPQRVHEYCEALSYVLEDASWQFDEKMFRDADLLWLKKGLRKSYSVIQYHLNSRDTTVARRNQVLYAIGKITTQHFDSGTVDDLIRRIFPATVPSTNMGIGTILSELSSGSSPVLGRTEKGNEYYVTDPRYVMCIRLMLYVDNITKKVCKRGFTQ